MGIQQARELYRHLFPSARRPRDPCGLGNVVGHSQAHASQQLNALGNRVNQFRLLSIVLVEQKMKLIKSGSGNLPVRFLVQIAQSDGIGQKLVEMLGHFQTDWFFQLQWQGVAYSAILLDLSSSVVKVGL